MFQLVLLAAARLLPFVLSVQASPLFHGATAADIDVARTTPSGIWRLGDEAQPGVFFDVRATSGDRFEGRILHAPLTSRWRPGDVMLRVRRGEGTSLTGEIKATRDGRWAEVRLTLGPIARGHEGIWAQGLSGTYGATSQPHEFYAERGCCDARYWISSLVDLHGEWTFVSGGSGTLVISGERTNFVGVAPDRAAAISRIELREIAERTFDGTVRLRDGNAVPARFTLSRGTDSTLELRATPQSGAILLRRTAPRSSRP